MFSNSSPEDELAKTKKHLSLLREQYVRLQREHSELQRVHSTLKAEHSSESSMQNGDNLGDPGLATSVLNLTRSLHRNPLYSDIEIDLKHGICPGHKFVLAARSGKWQSDQLNVMKSLDLKSLDSDAGDAIVKWMYTDTVDLGHCTDEFVIQLMKTASKYLLKGLQIRCEHSILSKVNVRNCIQFYQLAEEIGASSLKDYCSNLVSMHWNDLTADDFSSMAASTLYTMFKSKSAWPLHRAIRAKREDVVFLYMIEFTAQLPNKLNERDDTGDWPLQLALSTGQEAIARSLVSHNVDIDGLDDDGQTHLHRAIVAGDEFSSLFLINNGSSVNCATRQNGFTPLHAVSNIHCDDKTHKMESIVRIASLLLKKSANPNMTDDLGRSPLHLAILAQNMAVFKVLLQNPKTDLELRTRDGFVVLHLALKELARNESNGCDPTSVLDSAYSEFSIAGLLVKQGCNVNVTEPITGRSLLQLCALDRDEAGALYLAKNGANLNHLDFYGTACLHTAAKLGLFHLTEYLLQHGADPNVVTRKADSTENKRKVHNETALHIAIRCQHHDVVQVFLERRADLSNVGSATEIIPDFNIKDSEKQTVLALAIWSGYFKISGQLLSSGANINYQIDSGKTLLHLAIEKKDISSTLFLLEHQANISIKADDQQTALHLAVSQNLSVVVDAICLRGADMNVTYSNGDCVLWTALHQGFNEIASTLVRYGCDPTFWSKGSEDCEETLLHRAITIGNEDIAGFLIECGCDVDSPRREGSTGLRTPLVDGRTPLHLASALGLERTVLKLMKKKANVNAQDFEKDTALHIAVKGKHLEIVRHLLADPSINLTLQDGEGNTPFATAMSVKNNKCAEAILAREPGAAEQVDKKGKKLIHAAVMSKDLDNVLFLISIGSDVNCATCDGQSSSPLHLAVGVGDILIVRNLLLAGSDIHALDKRQQTPLHIAALNNRASIVSVLVEHGADVKAVDQDGNNVFHLCALHGCLETIQTLTQMLPDLGSVTSSSNAKQQNPLHLLAGNAANNATPMFECLLAAVPDYPLNELDLQGNTALLTAYTNGHGGLCRSLVRSGATLAISNHSGVNIFNFPVATKQMLFRLLDTLNQEPSWSEGNVCLNCGVKFGVATRKHHCRHCGRLLCAKCSSKVMPIIKFDVHKPTRVCDLCYDVLTLGSGAQ